MAAFLEQEPIPGIDYEYEFYKKNIDSITLEELNKVANDWITNNGENAVVILQAPEKESVKIPSQETVKMLFKNSEAKALKPYDDKVTN